MRTLRNYIESLKGMTGARASFLLIDPVAPDIGPLFLSTDDSHPVPGMETEEEALELTVSLSQSGREIPISSINQAVRYYRGGGDDTHFFRIAISDVAITTGRPHQPNFPIERRQHALAKAVGRPERVAWIGFHFDRGETNQLFVDVDGDSDLLRNEELLAAPGWLIQTLVSGAGMAWEIHELSALLRDTITGLTRRSELQVQLKHALSAVAQGHGSFALALINPDEFEQVNQRLGRAEGDAVLHEIGTFLQQSVRQPDSVYHYGGAVFAAHFWSTSESDASRTAERLRNALSNHAYRDDEVRLDFSVGAVFHGARAQRNRQIDTAEVLRRADSALNTAKASGGARTMVWAPQGFTNTSGSSDRLSGIFTADTRKDYRNMLLLWDTVQVISSHADSAAIANEFVDRVNKTFKPNRAALVSVENEGRPRLLSATLGMGKPSSAETPGDVAMLLSGGQRRLLAQAQQTQETRSACVTAPGGENRARHQLTAYAVPLPAGDKTSRCLYVDGPAESFCLDSADLVFLSVLAKQVAVALERSELALRWKREKERESHRLRAEVRELRQALRHSRLVYQSPRMEAVLDLVRKVAPTDATVLVTGESGTGKEMIARFLHDQSQRRKKEAFVTVDCGAIAPSLIETELFGHAKGAYTGANGSSKGRIVQAEGGTLFLDEIGELPLDVQAKLLRFVQEREITPVGSSRYQKIDARIVAATNRDLAAEVEAGRFRQDLYYRLRVISVTVPPLRQRPEDIMPLAQYFLETFAAQYEKPVHCLSAEAQRALREHPWVGNVRELKNQVLQAVIMSETEELGRSDLRLEKGSESGQRPHLSEDLTLGEAHQIDSPVANQVVQQPDEGWSEEGSGHESDSDCEPWEALRSTLARQVDEVIRQIQQDRGAALPLGVWLTEDLVVFAHEAYGAVARKAAEALGMAETTYRRQLEKINRSARAFMSPRSPNWAAAKPAIQSLVKSVGPKQEENLVLRARHLLLTEVVSRVPENDSLGPALMGVTKPTYRRWTTELSASATE